jgi:hypothetical protein
VSAYAKWRIFVCQVATFAAVWSGAKRRAGAWVPWELRPYERSRCAEHKEVDVCLGKRCARPTEYSYGRTTNAPAQRFNGANLTER